MRADDVNFKIDFICIFYFDGAVKFIISREKQIRYD